MKTLLKGRIVPVSAKYNTEFDGYVVVEGNKIISVSDDKPVGNYDKFVYGDDLVIMPGLVNTHGHASMTLLRGIADDLPLMDWLTKEIFPREDKLTPEMIYWGAKLAITEMLLGGTTTFSDMYFMMDSVAKAVDETGIRGCLSKGIMGLDGTRKGLDEAVEFGAKWNNKAGGRIKIMLGPHAIYTCPPEFMKLVITESRKNNLPLHMHVSETEKEVIDSKKNHGKTPPEILDDLGAFDKHFLAAHCVHLTPTDMKIFKEKNVYVSLNTSSNFKLASGRTRIDVMEKNGLNLSFGTDGASSNNDLDMWEELRWSSFLAKSFGDSTILPAERTLEIATKNGAEALGFDNVGEIKPGNLADLIVIDMSKPHLKPRYLASSHLVNCVHQSDVKHVMVNGEFVVWDREIQTFDLDETIKNVEKSAKKLE